MRARVENVRSLRRQTMTGVEDYREHRKLNLRCYECGADLEVADFEWYDENPYCIECYDEIVLDEDLEE